MACALLGFYMILKAVPQFASSIMTGSVSGMDGGMVRAAAAAGYGLGMSVFNTSRTAAHGVMGAARTVTQAAQAFSYTAQAARDTGSSPGEAKRAGAWEAFKTVMTGPEHGGSRAAGDRMYSDDQRAHQYAGVRNSGGADTNSLGSPAAASIAGAAIASNIAGNVKTSDSPNPRNNDIDTQRASNTERAGRISSAGTYSTPASQSSVFGSAVNEGRASEINRQNQADAQKAKGIYGSETDSWGSYESDKEKGGRDNGR
jgi:hypothetical protein